VAGSRGARRAAAFGALVALFISHRRGIYYALLTIAFGQVFCSLRSNGTRSPAERTASTALPPADGFVAFDLKSNAAFLFRVGVFALVVVALWRLVHLLGRILTAITERECAAFVGYNVWPTRLAFTIPWASPASPEDSSRSRSNRVSERDSHSSGVRRDDCWSAAGW
jgi:branched-chain amino acid transport system permease protein